MTLKIDIKFLLDGKRIICKVQLKIFVEFSVKQIQKIIDPSNPVKLNRKRILLEPVLFNKIPWKFNLVA